MHKNNKYYDFIIELIYFKLKKPIYMLIYAIKAYTK